MYWRSLFEKLGETSRSSSFHFSNFERIVGYEIGYVHGHVVLNLEIAYASLAWTSILVRQARIFVLESLSPLFAE